MLERSPGLVPPLDLLVPLALLIVLLTVINPVLRDGRNILNVFRQIAMVLVLGTGMTIGRTARGIDPSVGSTLALLGCISGLLFESGMFGDGLASALAPALAGFRGGPVAEFLAAIDTQERVRRLLRENGLQATARMGSPRGPRNHDGTVIPATVDTMCGTDMTAAFTVEHGQVAVFIAVDHCSAECVGIRATRSGAALHPRSGRCQETAAGRPRRHAPPSAGADPAGRGRVLRHPS